jgi:fibronectin type 3 domain-containing protein
VSDGQGGSNSDTATVVVTNAPPVVDAGVDPPDVTFGTAVSLDPATFTDAGVEDTHTAKIDWGDGTVVEEGALTQGAGSGSVAGSHSYTAAGTYTVTVTVTDDDDGVGSDTLSVVVEEEVEPPVAPSDLQARPKSTKVQLVWTHTGADSYNVYRASAAGGPYMLIGNTTSTYSTYLDENLVNGVRYYYVVTALRAGVESAHSNEASAVPSLRAR